MWIKLRLKDSSTVMHLHATPSEGYLRVSGSKSRQKFVDLVTTIVNKTSWTPDGKRTVMRVFQHAMQNPDMRIKPGRDDKVTVILLGESGAIFSSSDSCLLVD